MNEATAKKIDNHEAVPRPTLRDRARALKVEHLFADYFRVTNPANGHAYRVEALWLDGDVTAFCQCMASKVGQCKHEMAVILDERHRVASAQFGGYYA